MYRSIWEASVKMCSHLSWGYLVFIFSKARYLIVSVPISPLTMLCCRCRQHSTGSTSTGFRRWDNGWGLLLISKFYFISASLDFLACLLMFSSIDLLEFWAASHVAALPFLLLIPVLVYCPWWRSSHQLGLFSLHQCTSFRAWFWACSSTLIVCGWAVTRDSQLYVTRIIGRVYFCYVMFKVDRAHPHLVPARRFKTLMRLETREAILSTWFFKFNLLSKFTPRYLNSFD